jgi:nucleotide-binding universal stress UspA family protein
VEITFVNGRMYQRILVPVDGSDASRRALEQAIAVARLTGGAIRIVHVIDELAHVTGFETAETLCREVLPGLCRRGHKLLDDARTQAVSAGVAADVDLAECFAARVADILVQRAESWNADLIVMGTSGRRGAQRLLLGSDAEEVLRCANVPVLLVRSSAASPQAAAAGAPSATALCVSAP